MVRESIADILENHVRFEFEDADRLHLQAQVPSRQTVDGFVRFSRKPLGWWVPSTAMIALVSRAFVKAPERFAKDHGVDLARLDRVERQDDAGDATRRRPIHGAPVMKCGKAWYDPVW